MVPWDILELRGMTKCIRTREPRQSSGNGFHFMRNNQTNERIDTAYVLAGGKVFGMQERFRKRERVRFPFFAKKKGIGEKAA